MEIIYGDEYMEQCIENIKNKGKKYYNSAGQTIHRGWEKVHSTLRQIQNSELVLIIITFLGIIFPINFRIKKNASTLDYIFYVLLLWLCYILFLIIFLGGYYDFNKFPNLHTSIRSLIYVYSLFFIFIVPFSMIFITPICRYIIFQGISIGGKDLLKGDSSNWITYKSYYFSLGVISYFIKSLMIVFFIYGTLYANFKNPFVLDLEKGVIGFISFYFSWLLFLLFLGLVSLLIGRILSSPYDSLREFITTKYIFTADYPKRILDRCNEFYNNDIRIDLRSPSRELIIRASKNDPLYIQLKHSLIDPLEELKDILEFVIMKGLPNLQKHSFLTWKYFTGTSQISRKEIKNYVLNVVEIVYLYGTKDGSSNGKGDLKAGMNICQREFFDKLEKDGYYPLEDFIEKLEDIKIKGSVEHWKSKEKKGHLNYINIISESSYTSAERRIAYYIFAMTLVLLVFTIINILFFR